MAYSNLYTWWLNFIKNTKSSFKSIWYYRANRWYFLVFLILSLFLTWQAYAIYSNLNGSLLVLRYRVDFGASLIGESNRIFIYPLINIFIFLFNFFIALLISNSLKKRFLYNLIFIATNFLSLFMILYLMSVYLVNFS